MKNQVKVIKVTAIKETGATITSGWFQDVNKGEQYANAMTTRGFIVVKQYRMS